ncbi:MAG: NosD domain-containing protein [Candidatus Thorarchaeota archaeon]
MKAKHKNVLLFLWFLVILMITVPSLYTSKSQEEVDIYNLGNSQVSWNLSDYVEFIGPPIDTSPPNYLVVFRIFVDDEDPNYNWSKTVAENEWCTGLGSSNDPYIIEGLYIDAQGDGGGIYIKNSHKSFIIQNCWVNNSGIKEFDAGVLVRYSENGIIRDNIFSYTQKGVNVQFYSSNITVSGNYMVSDPALVARGVMVDAYCNDIYIIENVVVNFYSCMYVGNHITDCVVKGNYVANFIFKEWEDAPLRFTRVNDSDAIYNILDGVYTQLGVFATVSGGGDNIVTNNTKVSKGSVDVPEIPILSGDPKPSASEKSGIDLSDCYSNLVAHNRILSSSDEAILGYDTLLILSLAGFVIMVLVVKITIKKFKH